ncbi:MAG: DUF4976 domain-containing protein, partial [Planctomycetota bacterium]|nr:DUF4976 domain-containing protein [Planctomycetota bacterium]
IAGIEPPEKCHGRSLSPFFENEVPSEWRQGMVGAYYGMGHDGYTLRSYRDEEFKYVYDPFGLDEFYDLSADPGEQRNLIGECSEKNRIRDYATRLAEAL